MSPPRSPRTLRLLASLEAIYTSAEATPEERLKAATLAARILGKRKPSKPRKKNVKMPAPSTPPVRGSDLAPATMDPTPATVLNYFDNLGKK